MRYALGYGAALLALVALDLMWLRYASDAIFRPAVGEMLTGKPNLVAAALFYVFFAFGLSFFAIAPALRGGGLATAFLYGALLGFLGYMSFDLTNIAILKSWPLRIALIDMGWGTLVSGVAAAVGFLAADFSAGSSGAG